MEGGDGRVVTVRQERGADNCTARAYDCRCLAGVCVWLVPCGRCTYNTFKFTHTVYAPYKTGSESRVTNKMSILNASKCSKVLGGTIGDALQHTNTQQGTPRRATPFKRMLLRRGVTILSPGKHPTVTKVNDNARRQHRSQIPRAPSTPEPHH